ncbi:MAG: Gfo/Idh/MocA family oxidoreductase [Chthoniobacteraceae bacterium]
MLKVGLIGLGAMGRLHFDCWQKSAAGQLVAVSDRNPRMRSGDWGGQSFNLGEQKSQQVDMNAVATYDDAADLIRDPNVQAVDICTSTPRHADLAIGALLAGKHVFCEKPMALTEEDCTKMIDAAKEANRQLMIGHCLRYWPHYVKAKELIDGGAYGKVLHARFERFSALPTWSSGGWLTQASESGGVIVDMHIHDVDVARWWFGEPDQVRASGAEHNGLPIMVDALWDYKNGPAVHLAGGWGLHGGEFRHAFAVTMEKATLDYNLSVADGDLRMSEDGLLSSVEVGIPDAYRAELDDFAACVSEGRPITRSVPEDSKAAVRLALEELRQVRS